MVVLAVTSVFFEHLSVFRGVLCDGYAGMPAVAGEEPVAGEGKDTGRTLRGPPVASTSVKAAWVLQKV